MRGNLETIVGAMFLTSELLKEFWAKHQIKNYSNKTNIKTKKLYSNDLSHECYAMTDNNFTKICF